MCAVVKQCHLVCAKGLVSYGQVSMCWRFRAAVIHLLGDGELLLMVLDRLHKTSQWKQHTQNRPCPTSALPCANWCSLPSNCCSLEHNYQCSVGTCSLTTSFEMRSTNFTKTLAPMNQTTEQHPIKKDSDLNLHTCKNLKFNFHGLYCLEIPGSTTVNCHSFANCYINKMTYSFGSTAPKWASLILKPITGHNPEPVPPSCHPHNPEPLPSNLFLYISIIPHLHLSIPRVIYPSKI